MNVTLIITLVLFTSKTSCPAQNVGRWHFVRAPTECNYLFLFQSLS